MQSNHSYTDRCPDLDARANLDASTNVDTNSYCNSHTYANSYAHPIANADTDTSSYSHTYANNDSYSRSARPRPLGQGYACPHCNTGAVAYGNADARGRALVEPAARLSSGRCTWPVRP